MVVPVVTLYAAKAGIQSTTDQDAPRQWANIRQARGLYADPPSSPEDAIEVMIFVMMGEAYCWLEGL